MIATSVLLTVIGAIIGSFVGLLVVRLPAGRGVVAGRSICDTCSVFLAPLELVPIVSFLLQRGRCRHCQSAISVDQFIAECSCAIAGIICGLVSPDLPAAFVLSMFCWALTALALLDARHHWLPDVVTMPLLLGGLASSLVLSTPSLLNRLIGIVAGYGLLQGLRLIYRHVRGIEGLGGGDPKLFAAIGAWLGASMLPWILSGAGIIGLLVIGQRAMRGQSPGRFDRLPLGTFLAFAAILSVPFVCLID